MTMLSAQPVTLTGEQHERLWQAAEMMRALGDLISPATEAFTTLGLLLVAERLQAAEDAAAHYAADIERILIDAQDAAPPATASSGEAA